MPQPSGAQPASRKPLSPAVSALRWERCGTESRATASRRDPPACSWRCSTATLGSSRRRSGGLVSSGHRLARRTSSALSRRTPTGRASTLWSRHQGKRWRPPEKAISPPAPQTTGSGSMDRRDGSLCTRFSSTSKDLGKGVAHEVPVEGALVGRLRHGLQRRHRFHSSLSLIRTSAIRHGAFASLNGSPCR